MQIPFETGCSAGIMTYCKFDIPSNELVETIGKIAGNNNCNNTNNISIPQMCWPWPGLLHFTLSAMGWISCQIGRVAGTALP